MPREQTTEELLRELESGGLIAPPPKLGAVASRPGQAIAIGAKESSSSGLVLFLIAAIVAALAASLPFASLALYPFALFVTLVHETCHAIAAVASGGSVLSLGIASDLSGVTTSAGGFTALVAPAGYLGATLAGVALLLTPLRFARWTMLFLTVPPLAALLVFHPSSLFTALWCAGYVGACLLAFWKLPLRFAAFLQIFLGLEIGLNAFRDVLTLLFISSSQAHIHTDAENMSHALFLPPVFWAVLWTVFSVALLSAALLKLVTRAVAIGQLGRRNAVPS